MDECYSCDNEYNSGELEECLYCGELVCDECAEYDGKDIFCSIRCLEWSTA